MPENTGIISANVRFYVTGTNRAENVEVAAWADEVGGRLDDLLGLELPRQSGERLIQINLSNVPGEPRSIEIEQYHTDVGMIQSLLLQNVTETDQAAAVEALCQLLLCRYVLREKSFPVLADYDFPFPAWFVHGIASHFSPAMRMDNRVTVIRAWQRGMSPALGQVLSGDLPAAMRDAAQGELFEWLNDMPERSSRFRQVVQRVANGGSTDEEWFVHDILRVSTKRDASQLWDLHLTSLQHVLIAPGECVPEDVLVFRNALLVRPEVLSVAMGEDVIYTYRLGDLIKNRRASWAMQVADAMSIRINEAAVGKGDGMGQVAAKYLEFLKRLPLTSYSGYKGVLVTDTTDAQLGRLLADADRSLALFEKEVQARQDAGASSSSSSDID